MGTLAMNCWHGFALAVVIGLAYVCLLYKMARRSRSMLRVLLACALIIIMVNFVADVYVITDVAKGDVNVFSVAVLALWHSLELFVFQTHFFDNGYQEFFFGSGDAEGHTFFASLFALTFVLAAITSASLIIRAFSRRRAGRSWLVANQHKAGMSHVFFMGGEAATTLAADIKKTHPEGLTIYVGYPDPEDFYVDLSLWEKIKCLLGNRVEETLDPFDAIVHSRIPLSAASGMDICKQMRLRDLDTFLKNPSCKVYLLSDNEEENLHCVGVLQRSGCTAEVYVRACREGLNRMYEASMAHNSSLKAHLVDSSYLACQLCVQGRGCRGSS